MKLVRAFRTRYKEHMRAVNPKNLARLQNNDMSKKSALLKHDVDIHDME